MTQSNTPLEIPEKGFFFVLQPNETGATKSHQEGEIHVRKPLIGDVLPEINAPGQNIHQPFLLLNGLTGEFGDCTYTYWGGRHTPETRLRQFPKAWKDEWETDDLVVLIPFGPTRFIYFHLKPQGETPPGLEAAWRMAQRGHTSGRFTVGYRRRRAGNS
jgi:hypothetical protein